VARSVAIVAVAIGCVATLVVLLGSAAQHATGARRDLASLPAAAQGPISAALGRKEPVYRVVGLSARNPDQRLRVGFSRAGVAIVSGGARLRIALSAYGYSSALRPLAFVAPVASANRVSYGRGSLREWYANGPLGVEQGFDVAARPSAGIGPLTFSLALSGNLAAKLGQGSVLLAGRGVALRYGGLVATDARGRVLPSWLELARGRVLIRVDDRGAAYPLRVDPLVQQAELTARDGAAHDLFGRVAVSGNTIVVGAPYHLVGSYAAQGAVYVFVRPASGWANATQTAELTASDGAAQDRLGTSVAVSGNTVVAGAPYHTVGPNNNQGAAYVFVMPPSGWAGSRTETAKLTASGGAEEDRLGTSVAISGNTIVAGAPNRKATYAGQGAAYVFVMPPSGWAGSLTETAELTASDGVEQDELGRSVAVSGDTVVAGASSHAVGPNAKQGAAYVFVRPVSGWAKATQAAELTASDGAKEDRLGMSVAVSGSTVVAGAPYHAVGPNAKQGAAYVFVMPPSGWTGSLTATAELTAGDGAAGDTLGASVAVAGNTVIAGVGAHKVGANIEQGAAYVFVMPPSGWAGTLAKTTELTAGDGAAEDYFGASVALSGSTVIAGAPGHYVGSNAGQGAAYAFVAPPSIAIASPANGATYTQGQAVTAAYACGASGDATVVACAGPVANGAAIDTQTLGPHTFTVNAQDSSGATAAQSASYTVLAVVLPVPIISGASQTAKRWRESNTRPRISANKKKKLPVGTTFSFSLNEPAAVTLSFTQPAAGRKVHRKCVAPGAKNRRKPRCTRTILAGGFSFTGHPGTNKVRFAGRISRTKKLKPGRYTLQITATNTQGKRSAPRSLTFTIVK
jgi:hypothetical protein